MIYFHTTQSSEILSKKGTSFSINCLISYPIDVDLPGVKSHLFDQVQRVVAKGASSGIKADFTTDRPSSPSLSICYARTPPLRRHEPRESAVCVRAARGSGEKAKLFFKKNHLCGATENDGDDDDLSSTTKISSFLLQRQHVNPLTPPNKEKMMSSETSKDVAAPPAFDMAAMFQNPALLGAIQVGKGEGEREHETRICARIGNGAC